MDNDTQPEQTILPTPPVNNNYNWLKTLTIGFAIVSFCTAIGVIGYFWTIKNKSTQQNQKSISVPTITQSSPTPDETTNWQIYTNTKYGYLIKYPPKFSMHSLFSDRNPDPTTSPSVNLTSNSTFKSITIFADITKDENQSLSDFVNNEIEKLKEANKQVKNYYSLKIINDSVIDGRKAIFVSNKINSKELDLRVYIERDKINIIYIQLGPVYQGSEEEYKNFFYQELSTFKFTP